MEDDKKKNKPKEVEKIYQKKTPIEHILLRPDTYVGSIEFQKDKLWVLDKETKQLEFREVNYVPGLFKIFDEILVNAADNFQRDNSMSYIRVVIDIDKNIISVKNNGSGIPVAIHKEYNIYVPELIFGNLLTSSNYDDNDEKITGGRNGYGAKLTNIFSKKFIIETADSKVGKLYKQTFEKNMSLKHEPKITDYDKEDYTIITFEPDLDKFKMKQLDDDIVSLMTKRVYDMAGVTPAKVKVFINNEKIEVKNFSTYVDMYLNSKGNDEDEESSLPKVYEQPHDRWEIAASLSEGQFQQVSYVNSISTSKGGTHVNYVVEKVIIIIVNYFYIIDSRTCPRTHQEKRQKNNNKTTSNKATYVGIC